VFHGVSRGQFSRGTLKVGTNRGRHEHSSGPKTTFQTFVRFSLDPRTNVPLRFHLMTNNRSSHAIKAVNLDPSLSSPSLRSMLPASYADSYSHQRSTRSTRSTRTPRISTGSTRVGAQAVKPLAPKLGASTPTARPTATRTTTLRVAPPRASAPTSVGRRWALPVLAVMVVLLAALLLIGTGSSRARANGDTPKQTYTVLAGDTLWSVARSIQPTGDVRPLISKIVRTNHVDRSIVPGMQLVLP
jgi:LysM repeat protein